MFYILSAMINLHVDKWDDKYTLLCRTEEKKKSISFIAHENFVFLE